MKIKLSRVWIWLTDWNGWRVWRIFYKGDHTYWFPSEMTEDFWEGR